MKTKVHFIQPAAQCYCILEDITLTAVLAVLQNLQWGRFGYANLRYVNITLEQWGVWTGDWLHPAHPEVSHVGHLIRLHAIWSCIMTIC